MRILVIDDHALFREGLRLMLRRLGPDVSVLEAGSCTEGLAQSAVDVDLILLDLQLPGGNGAGSVALFRERWPEADIIILSGTDDAQLVSTAQAAGARGFIHKSSTPDQMLQALRQAMEPRLRRPADCEPGASPPLTPRQREVLVQLCEGLSNKEIARHLQMSDNTVRVHLYEVFRLLGVKTRTQAALLARNLGLV